MTFDIAGLGIRVDGLDILPQQMYNLEPFITNDDSYAKIRTICDIKCGCTIRDVDAGPTITNTFDGKTMNLWLAADFYRVTLRFNGSENTYSMEADNGWRTVSTDCKAGTETDCMALEDFIMISFIYSAAYYDTVLINASSVAVDSSAAVFIGPSGIGKSTHSRLWLRYVDGSRLLNDDQPALRIMPDGNVYVYGTPWSGKTDCYRNERAKLKAVFRMRQAGVNKAVRLDGTKAFCALLDMTSLIKSDSASFSKISDTVAYIAGKVDICMLYNRPEKEAVDVGYSVFSRRC